MAAVTREQRERVRAIEIAMEIQALALELCTRLDPEPERPRATNVVPLRKQAA